MYICMKRKDKYLRPEVETELSLVRTNWLNMDQIAFYYDWKCHASERNYTVFNKGSSLPVYLKNPKLEFIIIFFLSGFL